MCSGKCLRKKWLVAKLGRFRRRNLRCGKRGYELQQHDGGYYCAAQ
jgi:hypothetical protein